MEYEKPLILYVEDDLAHAEFTLRSLKKTLTGNRVIHLTDGQQALDYLFLRGKYSGNIEAAPRPQLILLDLRLPRVDGLEVLKVVKKDETLRCIPIIILTTSEAESDKLKAYQLNANSYLVKPMDIKKYSSMIESFDFYWTKWNKYSECNEK